MVSTYLPRLCRYWQIYLDIADAPYPDSKCIFIHAYKYSCIFSDLADADYEDGECISAKAL